jgi:hypothetical protein
VHVSLCNIEIEKDKITIAVKMFKDDFQLALYHNFGEELEYDEILHSENKKVVDSYINNALKIVLNKRDSLKLLYSDSELSEDAVWLFYSFPNDRLQEMDVKNELLLDIYADQTNLTIINHNGKQRGYRFNLRNTEKRINLK